MFSLTQRARTEKSTLYNQLVQAECQHAALRCEAEAAEQALSQTDETLASRQTDLAALRAALEAEEAALASNDAALEQCEEQMAEAASRVEELDASVVVEDGECDVGGQQQASSRPERGAAERAGGAEGSLRGPGGPRTWRGERAHRGANGASHGAA